MSHPLVRKIKSDDPAAIQRFFDRYKPTDQSLVSAGVWAVQMDVEEWKRFESDLSDGVLYAEHYTLLVMEQADTQPGAHVMSEPNLVPHTTCPTCSWGNVARIAPKSRILACQRCNHVWDGESGQPFVTAGIVSAAANDPIPNDRIVVEHAPDRPMPPDRTWMKLWKSHKTVRAEKIKAIAVLDDRGEKRTRPWLALECGVTISVGKAWFNKHVPMEGGFVVSYDDDYLSYSPADAFTKGYWLLDHSISAAWIDKPLEHAMVLLSNAQAGESLSADGSEQWEDSMQGWMRQYHERWKGAEPKQPVAGVYGPGKGLPLPTQPSNTSPEGLRNRYMYHQPKSGQQQRYESVRAGCLELALNLVALTPGSPEQSLMLNALDQVMFLANASIARRE